MLRSPGATVGVAGAFQVLFEFQVTFAVVAPPVLSFRGWGVACTFGVKLFQFEAGMTPAVSARPSGCLPLPPPP